MPVTASAIDLRGLTRLQAQFKKIANPDARPIIKTLMDIIHDDNRTGILAGLDKDGNKMQKVKYRPVGLRAKLTAAQRGNQKPNIRAGIYQDGGGANLTSSEYRRLDGPPLAPRKQFSRVITNLLTDFDDTRRSEGEWKVWGYWDGVVSRRSKKGKGKGGVAFLKYHFNGEGHNPQRDLRGLRPDGRKKARDAARNWMRDQVKTYA
jgi:hypothetical protein